MKEIDLVLTHVQRPYGGEYIAPQITAYIGINHPNVYQLLVKKKDSTEGDLNPIERFAPLIEEGELFESVTGEIPDDLASKLRQNKDEGHEVVLAGGVDGFCLDNTFELLKILELSPKKLYNGIFPPKGHLAALLRRHIFRQAFAF